MLLFQKLVWMLPPQWKVFQSSEEQRWRVVEFSHSQRSGHMTYDGGLDMWNHHSPDVSFFKNKSLKLQCDTARIKTRLLKIVSITSSLYIFNGEKVKVYLQSLCYLNTTLYFITEASYMLLKILKSVYKKDMRSSGTFETGINIDVSYP